MDVLTQLDPCTRCSGEVGPWDRTRDVEIREWIYPTYFARCSRCGQGFTKIKGVEGKPPPSAFLAEIQEARGVKGEG